MTASETAITSGDGLIISEELSRHMTAQLYRAMLRREPDEGGLDAYAKRLQATGLEDVLKTFLISDEFSRLRSDAVPAFTHLNFNPPMSVQTKVTPDEIDRLWAHISSVWAALGETDAFWSVLTTDRYKSDNLSDEMTEEFYDSGRVDLDYFQAYLRRAGFSASQFPSAVEYGCGVGRVTNWLAPQFETLRAVDISKSHLVAAVPYLSRKHRNIELRLLQTKEDLDLLNGFDVFFSLIVLQHNPPPIILDILHRAFVGLNPNGLAFFQVPTYSQAYSFDLSRYWSDVAHQKSMEMHFVPQGDILRLADECGTKVLEIRNDHCIGSYGETISSTFLLQKRA